MPFRTNDRISVPGNTVPKSEGTFSHLTVAEINGGIDGLILSEHASNWEQHSEITLSQIIDMYYNPFGVSIAGKGPALAACDRYANYFNMIDPGKLKEQAYVFGYEYKSILVLSYSEEALRYVREFLKIEFPFIPLEISFFAPGIRSISPGRSWTI